MKKIAILVVVLLLYPQGYAAVMQYNYSGIVTDITGAPIADALVSLSATGVTAKTDVNGAYSLEGYLDVASVLTRQVRKTGGAFIRNGELCFTLSTSNVVGVAIFNLKGETVRSIPSRIFPAGSHLIGFSDGLTSAAPYLVKLQVGSRQEIIRYIHGGTFFAMSRPVTALNLLESRIANGELATVQVIRASAAGYKSADTVSSAFSGTYNFTLSNLENNGIGTAGQVDGSVDRLNYWGNEQYFWGDPGTGSEIPLVKVITAISPEAVDIALIFNPGFVDNTYGTGKVGWNKHTFEQIVKSDHVEISVRNGNDEVVFFGKIDMLHQSSKASSGYGSLGPYGGDGCISTGSEESILSFGTSMDDNLNYYGYRLLENSPTTDSIYTPNPDYPNWEFYAIYRISFNPSIFGTSGYGDVQMTSVHASPAKTREETVTVTENDPPSDSDDPFTHTHFGEPPIDITENPDNPPTDTTDTTDNPPTDTTDTTDNPPTDTTDTTDNPPTDTTDTTDDPPTDTMDTPDESPSDTTETSVDKPPEDVLE